MAQITKQTKIKMLNDSFRKSFIGGQVIITKSVQALPADKKNSLYEAVKNFDNFNDNNDPYGEHDFGCVRQDGADYFFKIDYYNLDMTGGSEDSFVPEITTRVLTIMLAEEY